MPSTAERLARDFFARVWTPTHDIAAIDELMTEDYRITTAGSVVTGRDAFKRWVTDLQKLVGDARNEHLDLFTDAAGERVVSRWITRGTNKGILGLSADGRAIAFTGIAIWRVRGHQLVECWVERSAFELWRKLQGQTVSALPD